MTGAPALLAILRRELVRIVPAHPRRRGGSGRRRLIWAFFAAGFASTFARAARGASYAAFLLPGAITLSVTFSSIFSALSLIEDRNSGFLQGARLARPGVDHRDGQGARRRAVALAQGDLLLAAPFVGVETRVRLRAALPRRHALTSLGVTGVSLAFAWRIRSSEGFHGVMNLVLMPMWLLSGGF